MGKLHVLAKFSQDLHLETIEHDGIIMEHKSGEGGGKHLIRDIWDSQLDEIGEQRGLQTIVGEMIDTFKKLYAISIDNYRIEHRVYILDDEKFVGRIHDDSCEYSLVLYYRIDKDVRGGRLNFYDDDAKNIVDFHDPQVGDLVILDGVHAVGELYAISKKSVRSIIIVHINSEE